MPTQPRSVLDLQPELDRAHLLAPTNTAFGREVVWCPPAYADRSIVVRNDKEIIRVSLAAE